MLLTFSTTITITLYYLVVYNDRDYHCGQLVLNACYQRFEDLTVVGLGFPRPPSSQLLRVGLDLSPRECSHWAWATVLGDAPADYHNAYNYDWYAHRMLYDYRSNNSDIFALRMEHLTEDWVVVDRLLGGDGVLPSSLVTPQNTAHKKPLRVSSHSTTEEGQRNLCRALCDEIQVYKLLLAHAINLQKEDLETSLEELRQECPEETSIEPRICPH